MEEVWTGIPGGCRYVDLSYSVYEGMASWPDQMPTKYIREVSFDWPGYNGIAQLGDILISEHSGTHFDAMSHWIHKELNKMLYQLDSTVDPNAWKITCDLIDEKLNYPLIGHACIIDATAYRDKGIIPLDCIKDYEARSGNIKPGDMVLLNTGWAKAYYGDLSTEKYYRYMGAGVHSDKPFPVLSQEAAWYLARIPIKSLGSDSVSMDNCVTFKRVSKEDPKKWPDHWIFLAHDIPLIECINDRILELPERCYVIGMYPKIRGGSGGPLRLIAIVAGSGGI